MAGETCSSSRSYAGELSLFGKLPVKPGPGISRVLPGPLRKKLTTATVLISGKERRHERKGASKLFFPFCKIVLRAGLSFQQTAFALKLVA
jgi:hypothetical protein